MRFSFVLLLTLLANYFALLIMPWWIAMPIAFVFILLLPMKKWLSFLATAMGSGLCWLIIAFMADHANDHILSHKMAVLFNLPSYGFVIAITALIGFITGGLGGWTAITLRLLLAPNEITTKE